MEIKVSIVIPNYNGRSLLEKNLPGVLVACKSWSKTGWEIVVVDDASTDDSVEFLRNNYPQVKVVAHQKNLRFAASCNDGVEAARGKIIVLLNNDVSPDKVFLSALVEHFVNSEVFAVGCREIDSEKNKVFFGRGIMKFKRGLVVHWRAEDQNEKTTSWIAGGSGAFDRSKWLEIGGMDVLFRPAYEEDRDICYRAAKYGWKLLFEPKSIVSHHHETTNIKAFGANKIKIISFKNQFLFVWKNITDKKYLIYHLFWLPYHLLVTNFRTRGLLAVGFFLALTQLPEVIKSRQMIKKYFIKKDNQLI